MRAWKPLHNGQIATQYVDDSGQPTLDIRFNPNGSTQAIEGITSPDGRIFGKRSMIPFTPTPAMREPAFLTVPAVKFRAVKGLFLGECHKSW